MKLLTNNNNIIKTIANEIEDRGDRWYVVDIRNEVFKEYSSADMDGNVTTDYITLHETNNVPEYIEVEKYCYDEENGFYENINYIEPVEMEE